MKPIILILTLFTANLSLVAQKKDSCHHELAGRIFDIETKVPLAYVQVRIEGTDLNTYSDLDGNFYFQNLCNETNTLIVSSLGYCDTICEGHHDHSRSSHIYLKHTVKVLDEVTIKLVKKKEKGTETISQESISKESYSDNPSQTMASVISNLEGVTLASTGNNIELPVIHGLYGNRVLILNNGFKHGFQNWGTDHAPEIDISGADKITVIKGSGGVRYGPEALGGVVIVESDRLQLNKPFKASLGSGYQTNGKGYLINSKISQGLKKWSYHMGGQYTRLGDKHSPDYSLTNTGKIEKSFNTGIRFNSNDWDVKTYYSFIDQNLALLRSSVAESGNSFIRAINSERPMIVDPFSYDIKEPNQLSKHHLAKAEISWWYSDESKITFRAGKQFNQRQEYDVRRNAEKPIIDLDLTTDDYQLEWKHPDWLKLDGLIGLQAYIQNNDNNPGTGTTPFIPNYNTLRYSGFIVENLKMDKNTFEFGLRVDYEYNNVRGRQTNQEIFKDEYSFTNLTSSLGFIHQFSGNSTYRTNIGTAWRTPNMMELYSFGQHGFKTSFGLLRYYSDQNGDLKTDQVLTMNESNIKPEKGYKWINEWVTQQKSNTYTFVAYSHYIENYIYERPYAVIGTIRGPMPAYIFDQTNALFVGADLRWRRSWSKRLSGAWGLSYLWSRDVKNNDYLINQPPVTTSYKLSWEMRKAWKFESSTLSLKPSYTFKQHQAPRTIKPEDLINDTESINKESEIFDFKDAPEGYFLFDLSWNFRLKNIQGGLTLTNVFNTRYRSYLNEMRYFADEPGRNLIFSINYIFKSKTK